MSTVEEVLRKMHSDFAKENPMESSKVGVFKIIYLNSFYCRKGVNISICRDCRFDYISAPPPHKTGILSNVKRLSLIRKARDFEMSNLIFI